MTKSGEVCSTNNTGLFKDWKNACMIDPGIAGFADGDDMRVWEAVKHLLEEGSLRQAVLFVSDSKQNIVKNSAISEIQRRFSTQLRLVSVGSDETGLQVAAEYLKRGDVDSVLAGNISTTAEVIRAAIKGVGLKKGARTVSGSFFMVSPQGELLLFADCGVVIKPSVEQLVEIASASAETWSALVSNEPPRVAFLSFSTKGSAAHPEADKMRQAYEEFKKLYPGCLSDGEIQFDAAYVPQIAQVKCGQSPLNGRANCFVFPDLNAGNIAYKMVQRLGNFQAFGPILQGLSKPYSDLSRGASAQDIVASTYINQLRARLGRGT